MDKVKTLSRTYSPYLTLLATGLLAHGMLLLNDGSYADGWFLEYFINLGQWEVIDTWWSLHGYPIFYWMQRSIGQTSILAYRAISFTWILLAAVFQYKILVRFTPLTQSQSLYLTAFSLVWPFYHLLVWSVFIAGMICPVLYYAGWYGYLCLKERNSHYLLYLPSLILIFLSFNYPVFLTYHYAFLAIYGLSTAGYSINFQPGEFKIKLLDFLKHNWLLGILPPAFFYLKNTLYPVSNSYNEIKLFSLTTLLSIIKNLLRLITEPILAIIYSIPTFWFVLIPGLVAASFIAFKYLKQAPGIEDRKFALGMIGVGLILLVTISITYGVVWKTVKIMSVKSRYAFIANLGYGLFLMGGVHWLFDKYWARKKELIRPVLAVILVAMILVDINLYAMWQAKWAKTVSIIHNLKQIQPVPNTSIYFLKDEFPLGVDTLEYTNDFTFMLIEGWNQNRFIGITSHYQGKQRRPQAAQKIIREMAEKSLRFHSIIQGFDPKGCMAEVAVSPKRYSQEALIGFRYLFYRLFQAGQIPQFLSDLTEVKLRPLHIDAWGKPCDGSNDTPDI